MARNTRSQHPSCNKQACKHKMHFMKPVKVRLVGRIFHILQFGHPQAKTQNMRKMQIVSVGAQNRDDLSSLAFAMKNRPFVNTSRESTKMWQILGVCVCPESWQTEHLERVSSKC